MRGLALGLFLIAIPALGQRLIFTMITPGTSPVTISSIASSHDYGFQALTLLNVSDKTVESIFFRVTMNDEVVDGGHVYVSLEPGVPKSVDVFLGRMAALTQRARELKLDIARAIITVESVDFSDGTQWTGDPRVEDPK